jgi:hypothetical protein
MVRDRNVLTAEGAISLLLALEEQTAKLRFFWMQVRGDGAQSRNRAIV